MKKINFLWLMGILMVLPVSFVSCSDDDDEVGSSADLVGVWEEVYYEWWEKENGKITYDGVDEGGEVRVEFKADGTLRDARMRNGKWDWYDEGTWTYKNGVLTTSVTEDGETYSESVDVKELTATKLVIEWYYKETDDGVVYEEWERTECRKVSD